MFIIFPSAPGSAESTSDLQQQSQGCEQSLTWSGKHSPSRTWLLRLKREPWMQHLSTRICMGSHGNFMLEMWTSYLAAFHASRSLWSVLDEALMTHDTSGPQSTKDSELYDHESPSSRTSMESQPQSPLDTTAFSTMSSATWKAWVSEQRQDALQRRKSACHTNESDGSSSDWPTPRAMTGGPESAERKQELGRTASGGGDLQAAVKMWPTASSRDWKDTPGMNTKRADRPGNARSADQLPRAVFKQEGLQDQAKDSTSGKSRVLLNPAWVAQLMGFQQEPTAFVPLETQ